MADLATAPPPERARLLVLDDDETIRSFFEDLFALKAQESHRRACGFEFDLITCGRSEEALAAVEQALAESDPFAVAFIDLRMNQGPDGLWAAESIRRLDDAVEIVVITGYRDVDSVEITTRVQPADKLLYIQKPLHVGEVWQFAVSLSTKWHLQRQNKAMLEDLEQIVADRTAELLAVNRKLATQVQYSTEMELVLRKSEDKFRQIITSNADAIFILDKNGSVRFLNPAAEKLFNRPKESFLGEAFGFPTVTGERTDIDIIQQDGTLIHAEMRVTDTEWKGRQAFLASIRDITARHQMEDRLRHGYEEVRRTMKGIIQAMALAVETRDPYTAGHQMRVAKLAVLLAEEMDLSADKTEGIHMAGMIHDLGKMHIPSEILVKPTRLSDIEFGIINTHPKAGYDILKGIEFPWPVADIIIQHHEKMDGSGYPCGLTGRDILLQARIITVADVVEAIASHRPYRPALGIEVALEEISRHKGRLYDRDVVDAFVGIDRRRQDRLRDIMA